MRDSGRAFRRMHWRCRILLPYWAPKCLCLPLMKHLPLIIAVVALVVALFAWDEAHTALKRIEDFGLRPHPAVNP